MTALYRDWSPASVFCATSDEEYVPSEVSDNNGEITELQEVHKRPTARHGVDNNAHVTPPSSSQAAKKPRKLPSPPEHSSRGRRDSRQSSRTSSWQHREFAARVIQRRVRVWLLYQQELQSLEQVAALQRALEDAAAREIAVWFRRYTKRQAIEKYLAALELQKKRRNRAAKAIAEWCWRGLQAQDARKQLLKLRACRRIVCWCRHTLMCRRYGRRNRLYQFTRQVRRIRAVHCIRSAISSYVAQRREVSRQTLMERACHRIQKRFREAILRQEARAELGRLRARRKATLRLVVSLNPLTKRLWFARWHQITMELVTAEQARRTRAAIVLQRLFRVLLAAFRLVRRREQVVMLQSLIRGFLGRQLYRRMLKLARAKQRQLAPIHMQRVVRGFIARRQFKRILQQHRERFKCANCGLIEPGGLYCKFCGRRRTTFDPLSASVVFGANSVDAKLRQKRVNAASTGLPHPMMPAPPIHELQPIKSHQARNPRAKRGAIKIAVSTIKTFSADLPLPPAPSPSSQLPELSLSPRFATRTELVCPRKPQPPEPTRRFHRSLSLETSSSASSTIDQTRRRAEALTRLQNQGHAYSPSMSLHLQRLQKAGYAASR